MQIIDNIKKEKWDEFLAKQKQSQFLQSWQWGELVKKEGAKIIRVGVEDSGELIAVAALIKKNIFGFNYFFCPRGPIFEGAIVPEGCGAQDASFEKKEEPETTACTFGSTAPRSGDYGTPNNFLFAEIEKITKRKKIIFLRFEPQSFIHGSSPARHRYAQALAGGFVIQKTISIEPNKTSIIDLQKTEDKLLAAMHQKTRYNIRLAEKKGVTVRVATTEDFDQFWRIMKETVERDGFRLHSKEHYWNMLALDNDFIKLFLAEYNGRVVAAVLASLFGDMVTYIHGASADSDRNVMAPYLLHWQIIKTCKANGFKFYDLNGIDENKWPGVTRFKMGFGGETTEYPGTFDLVFNKSWYNVYKILRMIRRRI